jgi:hypothetical protein
MNNIVIWKTNREEQKLNKVDNLKAYSRDQNLKICDIYKFSL